MARAEDLISFDGIKTTPLGCIRLPVTYGKRSLARTIDTLFLILSCRSIYNCIVERLNLGRLEAVTFTIRLKVKFYSYNHEVVVLDVDRRSAQACYLKTDLVDQLTPLTASEHSGCAEVNLVDLDARYEPDSSDDEKDVAFTQEL